MSPTSESILSDRSKLIDTAITFLRGPQVQTTPLELRKQFLRKKGLSDEEINIACDRAGVNTYAQLDTSGHNHVSLSVNHQITEPLVFPSSWFHKLKEIAYAAGFISGLVYALYLFYKKFIKPWLFKSSCKSIENAIEDIEKLTLDSKNEVEKLHKELEKISDSQHQTKSTLSYEINELKSEITSLKGLLLSRKQFPATPAVSSPVSIPAWQLAAEERTEEAGNGSNSGASDVENSNTNSSPAWQLTNEDGNEEGGNGSNSGASDVEISNTNGSDSSLEMIRSCHENSIGNENN